MPAMESFSEYQASVALWQYCPPVLFAFGTFGNMMTILILRRMNMKRSAMPVYLTALALSDTCLLYTGLLRGWLINVFHLDVRTSHPAVCKVHTWVVYSCTYLSAWILSFMTMERTLSVWQPHRVSLLCSRGKAIVIVVVIILTSLLISCHLLYGMEVLVDNNATETKCYISDPSYLYFFDDVWSWADLTLSSLIPFTLVLVGNCLILWKVSLSVRAASYLSSNRSQVMSQRQKKTSSMTVMLVTLSVIFFVTTSPICVYNILEQYVKAVIVGSHHGEARLALAWAVVNILMYINSTINFYLYCLSGTRFRRELKRCLCHCCVEPIVPPSKNPEVPSLNIHSQGSIAYPGSHCPPTNHFQNPASSLPNTLQGQSVRHGRDSEMKESVRKPTKLRVLLSVQKYNQDFHSCSEF